jgi:septal ring factor EnvC (AmiA/AmiB activator)
LEVSSTISRRFLEVPLRASNEAALLLRSLSEKNDTILLLRDDITSLKKEKELLSADKTELEQKNSNLHSDIAELENTKKSNAVEIAQLSDKLTKAMQMNDSNQNEELAKIKTGLQNSLKVEYDNYLYLKERECNPNEYSALLGILYRIFDALESMGIKIS